MMKKDSAQLRFLLYRYGDYLTKRERYLIIRYYGFYGHKPLAMIEIARGLDLQPGYVSTLRREAEKKLYLEARPYLAPGDAVMQERYRFSFREYRERWAISEALSSIAKL